MIETTKISRVHLTSALIGQTSGKFELNLGKDEVAELQAVYQFVNMSDPAHVVRYGIYRKSDTDPLDISDLPAVALDKNWILWTGFHSGIAGFLGPVLKNEMLNMPPGIMMIRSPRLVAATLENITYNLMVALYYRTKTVSKDELAKLLMKYHA